MKGSVRKILVSALILGATILVFRSIYGITDRPSRGHTGNPLNRSILSSLSTNELEGVVDSLHLADPNPFLILRDTHLGQDQRVSIPLDPHETVVLQKGSIAPLDELMPGQKVKVYVKSKEGKDMASSVVIVPPLLSFPTAPSDKRKRGE